MIILEMYMVKKNNVKIRKINVFENNEIIVKRIVMVLIKL